MIQLQSLRLGGMIVNMVNRNNANMHKKILFAVSMIKHN